MRTRPADERGSIPIMMTIILVVSALVITTLETVDVGLRNSRRAGDSANALQVADAGVNDAIQQTPTIPRTTMTFTRSGSLGSSGTYTYTATRDPIRIDLWHIDVLGTDQTGLRRHLQVDAIPASVFNSPLFVNSGLNLASGVSLDSFSNGTSAASLCTGKGILGTNTPNTMSFGNNGQGQGVNNCKKLLNIDPTWDYSMDGCTSFGDGSQALPPIGTGQCPPEPATFKTLPKPFTPARVYAPGTSSNPTPADYWGTSLICDPTAAPTTDPNPGAANRTVTSLLGGKIYYYSTVELRGGCTVTNPLLNALGGINIDKPTYVYGVTRIDIGNRNGQGGWVNTPPQGNTVACGPTATTSQQDGRGNPGYFYCPLWSAGLRVRMLSASGGGTNSSVVNIRSSGTKFWGAVEVPSGTFTLTGSQIEVWGAASSNSASSNAQFTWHFDDALVTVTHGQYGVASWREAPLR
ncbi:MAG TPA: hypothetical protein VFJ85_09945 [Acidimicrobiales bacterium]|nr:hypothetical protein [Acidimicrobiales bacterium]